MFGTLGGPELFLILVVALIVFGPRKLPEIGKSLGRMMAEFRKASNEFKRTIENEVEADKIRESMRIELPRLDTAPSTAPPTEFAPRRRRNRFPLAPPKAPPPPSPFPLAAIPPPPPSSPSRPGARRAAPSEWHGPTPTR